MRHLLHKAICWYLRRCGDAFHCYEYGAKGRYVVLITEQQYHALQHPHVGGVGRVVQPARIPSENEIRLWESLRLN